MQPRVVSWTAAMTFLLSCSARETSSETKTVSPTLCMLLLSPPFDSTGEALTLKSSLVLDHSLALRAAAKTDAFDSGIRFLTSRMCHSGIGGWVDSAAIEDLYDLEAHAAGGIVLGCGRIELPGGGQRCGRLPMQHGHCLH